MYIHVHLLLSFFLLISHLKTCIIILCRQGKFYKFDIISEDGRVQTPLGTKRCLEKIVSMAGGEDRYIISESTVVYMCISDCCALTYMYMYVYTYCTGFKCTQRFLPAFEYLHVHTLPFLTLGAHAQEGYSSCFVCLSVCPLPL